jgi:phospholipase/carboxylesterase
MTLIQHASEKYEFLLDQVVIIGYSNGANIASSLLLSTSTPYLGALLHHPMVPFRKHHDITLSKKPILILAGSNDPICPKEEAETLFHMYKIQNAQPTLLWFDQGHRLTSLEMNLAKIWYEVEILSK